MWGPTVGDAKPERDSPDCCGLTDWDWTGRPDWNGRTWDAARQGGQRTLQSGTIRHGGNGRAQDLCLVERDTVSVRWRRWITYQRKSYSKSLRVYNSEPAHIIPPIHSDKQA